MKVSQIFSTGGGGGCGHRDDDWHGGGWHDRGYHNSYYRRDNWYYNDYDRGRRYRNHGLLDLDIDL
ncbi:MAG TPA: hypothetical protein VFW64_03825 [Pseudonocardiaceae bacterium]|nr:hypothetical protein [Pseudonocardiaceae bacterium]